MRGGVAGGVLGVVAGCLVAGCGCPPAVDVRGGTPEERARIGELVDAFVASVGEGRVCVPKITVAEVARGDGRYNSVTRGIRVDPGLSDADLARAVNHELCHDVDLREGLSDRDAAWLAYDDAVRGELYGERRERREVFAEVCQVGPLGIHLLGEVACGEHDRLLDAVAAVRDEVYLAPPDAFGPPPELVEVASWDASGAVAGRSPVAGLDLFEADGLLGIRLHHLGATVDELETVYVDFLTGEPVAWQGASPPETTGADPFPGLEVAGYDTPRILAGWPEGPALQRALASVEPYDSGGDDRLLHFDGERYGAPGCAEGRVPFTWGPALAAGWWDEDARRVRWGTWRDG